MKKIVSIDYKMKLIKLESFINNENSRLDCVRTPRRSGMAEYQSINSNYNSLLINFHKHVTKR